MKYVVVFITLMVGSWQLSAQVVLEKSSTVIKTEGKSYYLHTVKHGHTLYSISQVYEVKQSDILKANQMQSPTLKVGQKLKIPVLNPVDEQAAGEPSFFYHRIEQGETLYSIARRYNVGLETILTFNPRSRYGLQIGQVLTIPNAKQGHIDQDDENFYYHTVVSGETLFSLGQRYGISIQQIQLFNPETKHGLTAGSTLKIPKTSYEAVEKLPVSKYDDAQAATGINDPNYFIQSGVTPCFNYRYKNTEKFTVALMLPLFIEQNLWALRNYDEQKRPNRFFGSSGRFIEFYEGALLAVNQIKYDGVSVDLHIFDTKNSETEVRKIINEINIADFDLIIGPVYSANFQIVAQAAKRHKVNIVSPLSGNSANLINNPYVFQAMPSSKTRIRRTSDLISKLYDSTIVIVHNGTKEELADIEIYKRKLVKSFASKPNIDEIAVKIVDYNFGGRSNLQDAFSVGAKNVVLIPDNNEPFVTRVAEQLFLFAEDYDISLIGVPGWETFQNINISHLQRMEFNFASPHYIDYDNWRVRQFIKKYRAAYKTEPGIFAFQGYDITYYFLMTLQEYGKHFQFCIQNNQAIAKKGIVFDFDYVRTGRHNGFENKGVHFLTYDSDYRLKKTKIR